MEVTEKSEERVPLLAVLAHAHPSAVAGARVAAGALADLEADAAAGAAGGPGRPGGPGSVPEGQNAASTPNRSTPNPRASPTQREKKRPGATRIF